MRARFSVTLLVAATVTFLSFSGTATAVGSDPKPIPGGIQIPDGPLIHVFAPGPVDLGFQGEDVEPNTITDFSGFSAMDQVLD